MRHSSIDHGVKLVLCLNVVEEKFVRYINNLKDVPFRLRLSWLVHVKQRKIPVVALRHPNFQMHEMKKFMIIKLLFDANIGIRGLLAVSLIVLNFEYSTAEKLL